MSELNRDVDARIRMRWRGSQLLEMNDVRGGASQNPEESVDVPFADHRDDIALRLFELLKRRGHGRVPFVDQDALRGR